MRQNANETYDIESLRKPRKLAEHLQFDKDYSRSISVLNKSSGRPDRLKSLAKQRAELLHRGALTPTKHLGDISSPNELTIGNKQSAKERMFSKIPSNLRQSPFEDSIIQFSKS